MYNEVSHLLKLNEKMIRNMCPFKLVSVISLGYIRLYVSDTK